MLPHDKIILYDGACGLCSKSVQWVLRHDPQGLFKFAAIQSELGQKLYREAGLDPADPSTLLLAIGERRLLRSSASLEIARQLRFPWCCLSVLKIIPTSWRDGTYAALARRRKWFGEPTCALMKPEWHGRFLD